MPVFSAACCSLAGHFGPQQVETEGNDCVTSAEISLFLCDYGSDPPKYQQVSCTKKERKSKGKTKAPFEFLDCETVTRARLCVLRDRSSEKHCKWKASVGGDLASPPLLSAAQQLSEPLQGGFVASFLVLS